MSRERLTLAAFRSLGMLPAPLLALLGYLLGVAAWPFARRRRRIAAINLRLCFPERGALWRSWIGIRHAATFGRFIIDHALLLACSEARLKRLVLLRGVEHLPQRGTPFILVAPHFLGFSAGATRLFMEMDMCGPYTPQRSRLGRLMSEEAWLRFSGRPRAETLFASNKDQAGKFVAALGSRRVLYYLCDLDYGSRARHVFVPFLGAEQCATTTILPRLARVAKVKVAGVVTTMRPFGGYEVKISAPWNDFPSGDDRADMKRFNEFVSEWVRHFPAQYHWMHRRFKTQPPGAPDVYAAD